MYYYIYICCIYCSIYYIYIYIIIYTYVGLFLMKTEAFPTHQTVDQPIGSLNCRTWCGAQNRVVVLHWVVLEPTLPPPVLRPCGVAQLLKDPELHGACRGR